MVTVAIVHKCTILPQLIWVFFEQKCVKRIPFSILHKFTQSDVIALSPKDGKVYTRVKYSAIMRALLRGEYKRGKGIQF